MRQQRLAEHERAFAILKFAHFSSARASRCSAHASLLVAIRRSTACSFPSFPVPCSAELSEAHFRLQFFLGYNRSTSWPVD